MLRSKEAVLAARSSAKGDEKVGVDIIAGVLDAPLKQIADNCGLDGSVIADEALASRSRSAMTPTRASMSTCIRRGLLILRRG